MTKGNLTGIFASIRRWWRVRQALRAKLPFDDLGRLERLQYLKKLDELTFHPQGVPGIQEAELREGRTVVFQDKEGNILELTPDGQERVLKGVARAQNAPDT